MYKTNLNVLRFGLLALVLSATTHAQTVNVSGTAGALVTVMKVGHDATGAVVVKGGAAGMVPAAFAPPTIGPGAYIMMIQCPPSYIPVFLPPAGEKYLQATSKWEVTVTCGPGTGQTGVHSTLDTPGTRTPGGILLEGNKHEVDNWQFGLGPDTRGSYAATVSGAGPCQIVLGDNGRFGITLAPSAGTTNGAMLTGAGRYYLVDTRAGERLMIATFQWNSASSLVAPGPHLLFASLRSLDLTDAILASGSSTGLANSSNPGGAFVAVLNAAQSSTGVLQ